jgi:hypothetical protein
MIKRSLNNEQSRNEQRQTGKQPVFYFFITLTHIHKIIPYIIIILK